MRRRLSDRSFRRYAYFLKLLYHSTECIYSPDAYRGHARQFLKDVERVRPSAIMDIIHSGEAMKLDAAVRQGMKAQRESRHAAALLRAVWLKHSLQKHASVADTSRQTISARHACCWRDWRKDWRRLPTCGIEAQARAGRPRRRWRLWQSSTALSAFWVVASDSCISTYIKHCLHSQALEKKIRGRDGCKIWSNGA